MIMSETHYEMLGVAADASEPQIRMQLETEFQRVEALARIPARRKEAETRKAALEQVQQTLLNPEVRGRYDAYLEALSSPARSTPLSTEHGPLSAPMGLAAPTGEQAASGAASDAPPATGRELKATTEPRMAENPKATVFIYRCWRLQGFGYSPAIYCDEAELTRMKNGRYFAVRLDEGKHTIHSDDKRFGLELDVTAGQCYYIRVDLVSARIYKTSKQVAYEVMKHLRPIDPASVRDDRVFVAPLSKVDAISETI
jgi:curved DNA-binding protein CbpA